MNDDEKTLVEKAIETARSCITDLRYYGADEYADQVQDHVIFLEQLLVIGYKMDEQDDDLMAQLVRELDVMSAKICDSFKGP